jgi:hypothetical protein
MPPGEDEFLGPGGCLIPGLEISRIPVAEIVCSIASQYKYESYRSKGVSTYLPIE